MEKHRGQREDHTERLMERLESLAERLDNQFAQRLTAVERELEGKVNVVQCRELIAEALKPLDAWMEDLAGVVCRRPLLQSGRSNRRPSPERTALEQRARQIPEVTRRDAAARRPNRDLQNEGQRSNSLMSVIVEFKRESGAPGGSSDEVCVEVRQLERLFSLKQKALGQLHMWGRFCRIGQLAEEDLPSDEEDEATDAALALPEPGDCGLFVEEDEDGKLRLLPEQDTVRECGLQHGAHLFLVQTKRSPPPCRPRTPSPVPPVPSRPSAPPPVPLGGRAQCNPVPGPPAAPDGLAEEGAEELQGQSPPQPQAPTTPPPQPPPLGEMASLAPAQSPPEDSPANSTYFSWREDTQQPLEPEAFVEVQEACEDAAHSELQDAEAEDIDDEMEAPRESMVLRAPVKRGESGLLVLPGVSDIPDLPRDPVLRGNSGLLVAPSVSELPEAPREPIRRGDSGMLVAPKVSETPDPTREALRRGESGMLVAPKVSDLPDPPREPLRRGESGMLVAPKISELPEAPRDPLRRGESGMLVAPKISELPEAPRDPLRRGESGVLVAPVVSELPELLIAPTQSDQSDQRISPRRWEAMERLSEGDFAPALTDSATGPAPRSRSEGQAEAFPPADNREAKVGRVLSDELHEARTPAGTEEKSRQEPATFNYDPGQCGPVSLLVSHHRAEVMVEARASDSVEVVKGKAHAQLGVWYRFTAVAGSDQCDPVLPPVEECELCIAGTDQASEPLQEQRLLSEYALESGSHLLLRSST